MEKERSAHIQFSDVPQLARSLDEMAASSRQVFVLTDTNVAESVLPLLVTESASFKRADIIEVESGESSKCLEIANHIWSQLAESNAGRQDLLINLGGGMVTDLGGFIASTFKRGMSFIHIPTSLMAMTDAALGGKTGIDHGAIKNLIGTFAQAQKVLICPDFLRTLPTAELYSGFAEMLKHALICDRGLWERLTALKNITPQNIEPSLETSIMIKQEICNTDPLEKGMRKLLNFGHTFGHAIESVFLEDEVPLPHGHAVAIGMRVESRLSSSAAGLPIEERNDILDVLERYFPIPLADRLPDFEQLVRYLKNDKKNSSSETLNFTLLEEIGRGQINQAISMEQAHKAWTEMLIG